MSDLTVLEGYCAELFIAGTRLVVDREGGLFWPERALLVVADLHLEKGAAFAARGVMLPPYDTPDTLQVVERLVERYRPDIVIALGDSFHRSDSHLRITAETGTRISALTGAVRWIWVGGNHDPDPPRGLGGQAAREVAVGRLTFRHEPAESPVSGEIAGHLHPVARLRARGRVFRRRCFVASGGRVVMPALGAYAGGVNVLDKEFLRLFPDRDFRAWMLGDERIYPLIPSRLSCDAGAPVARSAAAR